MPLKNYTTKIPALQTVGEIQGLLATHGARQIMMEYTTDGHVDGVSFTIDTPAGLRGFRLPTRVDKVATTLIRQNVKSDFDHAERVAWRGVKDWIESQLAFLETEQATMDEIFLPYMVNAQGNSVYQLFATQQLALGTAET